MQISTKDWKNYIAKLSKLNATAAEKMQQYIAKNGFADTEAIIDYAYGLVTKYGEGSAALSAQMFETVAEMEGAVIQPAVMAQTASRNEVAKMVNGIMKQTQNENVIANAVGRKVKQAGADTTLQNALRYGAEFAWIPAGDTCAFCIALASRGWQLASKKAIKNGHAEHIHSNCDCTYAIRFDSKTHIEGYDPKYYERMYYDAQDRAAEEGTFWSGKSDKDAINQMRRDKYKLNAEKIREQHRQAYAKRKEAASITSEPFNNSLKYGKIYIDGDEIVPCLRDNSTGQLVDTLVEEAKRNELKGYNEKTGWYVNWNKMSNEASIYKLTVKGSDEIQGLIAMTPNPEYKAMYLNWVVSAPQNNPMLLNGKAKRYEGVGGHLMAIAAEKSAEAGFDGAAYGFAANADLAKYYIEKFGGSLLPIEHPYEVFYSEDAMKKLLEAYNYEWKR